MTRFRLDDRRLEVAVGAVAQACRSGETLGAALRSANTRHPTKTFTALLTHHDSGTNLATAGHRVATEATDSPDATLTANVVAMAATVGGPVEHHFDALALTLADRRNAAAERSAQASTARASMRVMTWIPIAVGGWLATDDAAVRHTMFATPIGLMCLTCGLVLNTFGRFWARSLIASS